MAKDMTPGVSVKEAVGPGTARVVGNPESPLMGALGAVLPGVRYSLLEAGHISPTPHVGQPLGVSLGEAGAVMSGKPSGPLTKAVTDVMLPMAVAGGIFKLMDMASPPPSEQQLADQRQAAQEERMKAEMAKEDAIKEEVALEERRRSAPSNPGMN